MKISPVNSLGGGSSNASNPPNPKVKSSPSLAKSSLKMASYLSLSTTRLILYFFALLVPLIGTPEGNKIINSIITINKKKDTNNTNHQKNDYEFRKKYHSTKFLESFPAYPNIIQGISKAKTDQVRLNSLLLSKLDSEADIQNLIDLVSKDTSNDPDVNYAIVLLEDFKQIQSLTYGKNGLDFQLLCSDNSLLNEQLKFFLKMEIQNKSNDECLEKFHSMVNLKVTGYEIIKDINASPQLKEITYSISLEGFQNIGPISITCKNLDKKNNNIPKPLVIHLSNQIFESLQNTNFAGISQTKEVANLGNYDNHIVILTSTLTDDELERILSNSNSEIIPVLSFPNEGKFRNIFSTALSLEIPSTLSQLDSKNLQFVKRYDRENKSTTVLGLHNKSVTYTNLEQFREDIPVLVIEKKHIPPLSLRTSLILLLTAGVSISGWKLINKAIRLSYPEYRSLGEKSITKLFGKPNKQIESKG